MISSLIIYFSVFFISSYACYCYEMIIDRSKQELETQRLCGFKVSFYSEDALKLLSSCFILFPPVFLATFRGFPVGTDTEAYLLMYENLKDYDVFQYLTLFASFGSTTEIGYQQIQYISYVTGGGYNLVKFISTFLVIFFVWRGALYYHNKFQINTGFLLFFFYLMEFGFALNGVRYAIAMSIFFYGFQFVIEKGFWKYFLCCCGMVLFHVAMSFCILFYLINYTGYRKLRRYWQYIAVIAVIIAAFFLRLVLSSLLPSLIDAVGKLGSYNLRLTADYGTGILYFTMLLMFPVLRWSSFVRSHVEWSCILIAVLLYIPFRLMGYFNPWVVRLTRMPEVLLCILYCGAMKLPVSFTERLFWKVYTVAAIIVYFIYTTVIRGHNEIIPYIFDLTNYI